MLATATTAHLRVSIAISVIAMLVFNFFLLPPFYTLTIADPQNWVALFVFIVVAVIASQLSAAVRQRASEADSRKQEVTRLFDLSRDILLTTDSERAIADVARYVARRFELETIAICLPTVAGWELHQGAERSVEPTPEQLNQAFARLRGPLGDDARQRAYGGHHVVRDHGTEATSFRFDSARSPLGFWRPRALIWISERSMPSEVSSRSPSSVPIFLPNERRPRRSVSEPTWRLRFYVVQPRSPTPVTSVRVAVTNLQDVTLSPDERQAQAQLALQELDRLTRLFQDILDMARIDAAAVNPDRRWVSPADVVDAAVTHVAPAIAEHALQIDADGLSEIQIDPRLTSTALAHVLENAGRARRPGQRFRCAHGQSRMAPTSSCGTTAPGLMPRTLNTLSCSIAVPRRDTPPARDWGSRSRGAARG